MIKLFLLLSLLKTSSTAFILNYKLTETIQKESKPTRFRLIIL